MRKSDIINIFRNIPSIETKRTILRKIHPDDYIDMYEYAHSDKVTKYLLWNSHRNPEYTKEYAKFIQEKYRDGEFYDWAITLKENGKMIGTVGFTSFDFSNNTGEIGYVLNENFWHMGIASECVDAVLNFGFSVLGLGEIFGKYMKKNTASMHVMLRSNMTPIGIEKNVVKRKFGYMDVVICSILSSDYFRFKDVKSTEK